jgi:hypothetical protein
MKFSQCFRSARLIGLLLAAHFITLPPARGGPITTGIITAYPSAPGDRLPGTSEGTLSSQIGPFSETHPSGAVQTVPEASIPEPETLLLIGAALLLLSRLRLRK